MILDNRQFDMRSFPDSGHNQTTGRFEQGTPVSDVVNGSVQPISGNELEQFEGGRREKMRYKLYTEDLDKVHTVDESTGRQADQVFVYGEWLEATAVEPWRSGLVPHDKVFLSRVEVERA